MAKKKNKKVVKAPKQEIVPEVVDEKENLETEIVEEVESDKKVKGKKIETNTKNDNQQKASKKKSKDKKPMWIVRKSKEIYSELKKVSWPSFKTVCKNTGVVIVVVLIFTIVLFGIDRALAALYNLIPR